MVYEIKIEDGRTCYVGNVNGPVVVTLSKEYIQRGKAFLRSFERAVRKELSSLLTPHHEIIFEGVSQ